MEVRESLSIIWKHMGLVVVAAMLVAGLTYAFSAMTVPSYDATATLEIDLGADSQSGLERGDRRYRAPGQDYVEQFKSPALLQEVVGKLGLALSPAQLAGLVSAEQVGDTQLIAVTVEHSDPALAREIANTIGDVFIEQEARRQATRFRRK